MASDHGLPPTHRFLVYTGTSSPPSVQTIPTPQLTPGSAVIRILAAGVIPPIRGIYDITAISCSSKFVFPMNGHNAIGRVAAVGPDSTKLKPGQLVLVDPTVRSRDDPTGEAGWHGGFTDARRRESMPGKWRDSTFAEYAQRVSAFGERVEVVPITSDAQADLESLQRLGPIDAFFELPHPHDSPSNYIKTAIQALRPGGRVSLMGGFAEDVPLPIFTILLHNLTLKGKFMYDQEDIAGLLKMVETGVLRLDESPGVKVVRKFALEDWKEAFKTVERMETGGMFVIIVP